MIHLKIASLGQAFDEISGRSQARFDAPIDFNDEFDMCVHGCLEAVCRRTGRRIRSISESFASELEAYSWPGQYLELWAVLESAVRGSRGSVLKREDLPAWFFCRTS